MIPEVVADAPWPIRETQVIVITEILDVCAYGPASKPPEGSLGGPENVDNRPLPSPEESQLSSAVDQIQAKEVNEYAETLTPTVCEMVSP